MTPNAKRYIALDKQITTNETKAKKFESGYNYDPVRRDTWQSKANEAMKKQQSLKMSDKDNEDVNDYYGCYCN